MAPLQQLVGSIAADMAKRVENPFDSDGTEFQLPVESLPVVRLLQPMVDGQNELDYDCPDDQWDVVSLVEQPQPPATPPPPTPNEDMPSSVQPNADPNTAATKSPNVSGVAASCTFAAATATRDACRPQRGRMALFGKDSERSKNDIRPGLLTEEQAMCLRLLQEDHADMLLERARKREFQKQVEELELLKQGNDLDKQKLEIEILQIEKEMKKAQLHRLQRTATHQQ
ncbi:hypothetical protein HPB50_018427 [Hyalomma asiaticum]|uniref:Uncharacterized protein n=1 Tax=Hyalomma asiaticum TaxID=266040 RepID=A0ACB7RLL2_HYAAI|nr:hypothetical protein HPB50_018427 [Hyalomma asiaticum]